MGEYSVERDGKRVVIRGSIPIQDLVLIMEDLGQEGMVSMATGVASALGATFAICPKNDVDMWLDEVRQNTEVSAGGDKELEWLYGPDTGVSSLTIFSVLSARHGYLVKNSNDIPYDPSDFSRCHKLLEKMPEWRDRLQEVAAQFPQWEPFVREWPSLTALYLEEKSTGRCPRLYESLRLLE